jgi:hypothetical protein
MLAVAAVEQKRLMEELAVLEVVVMVVVLRLLILLQPLALQTQAQVEEALAAIQHALGLLAAQA